MRLLGYTDRITAAPGDTVRFMVSCDHPRYRARLVRLIHGDTNPAGPGFKHVVMDRVLDEEFAGRHQAIRSGSYLRIPGDRLTASRTGWSFTTFLQPTLPGNGAGPQAILSQGDPTAGAGWTLQVGETGALEFVVGQRGVIVATGSAVRRWDWLFVAVIVDAANETVSLVQRPLRKWPDDPSRTTATTTTRGSTPPGLDRAAPLVMASILDAAGLPVRPLNGRLDRPRLIGRPLTPAELEGLVARPDDLGTFGGDLVAAWDFAADIATDVVRDISSGGNHGVAVNMPTRAVTGHNFTGMQTSFHLAPAEYGAIHFHADDLEDAGWAVDFSVTIPDDLPSGVYAAWLTAGDDEDHLSFFVRPPRGTSRSPIAVLASTMTYVTYSNFTDLGPYAWQEGARGTWTSSTPHADPTLFRDVFRYIDENALYGLYDHHLDGSGVIYGSALKPNLTMRPKFRYRIWGAPPRFPADLYLTDWFDAKGIEVDYITDHDLQMEGAELLRRYQVVVSSSHHEYWTAQMLDGLESYLAGGGRFMYLGGNSLFGVISQVPEKPHAIELRRWGAPWPFEVPPAERYHSSTGEPGGIWRNRGRAPNTIVGIGTAAAGFDRGSPYKRMPGSFDPRVAFVFEGVGPDELIGDFPSLQVKWGAGGYEIDRYEPELGSPHTAIVLASTNNLSDAYRPMVDEVMWFIGGRDGATTDSPQVPGEPHRFVRADIVYLDYPNDGAVFSVGAICWRGCISWNGYDNNVSRITENVLRRFARPGPIQG